MAIKDNIKRVAKYGVMVVNFIFFVFGLVIIIMAAAGLSLANGGINSQYGALFGSIPITVLASMILMSGCITLIASITGFVAAWKEIRVALIIYVVILFIICCIQLAMGAYLMKLNAASLEPYWDDDQENSSSFTLRQLVMKQLKCCGFNSILEYQLDPVCDVPTLLTHPPTCRDAINKFISDSFGPLAAAAVAIGVIEVLALAGAMLLVFSSKDYRDEVAGAFHY